MLSWKSIENFQYMFKEFNFSDDNDESQITYLRTILNINKKKFLIFKYENIEKFLD